MAPEILVFDVIIVALPDFHQNFHWFRFYHFLKVRENPRYRIFILGGYILNRTCPLFQLRSIIESSIEINSFFRGSADISILFVGRSVRDRHDEPCPCEISIVSDISEVSKSNFLKQCAAVKTMRDDFNELNIGCHKSDMTVSDC